MLRKEPVNIVFGYKRFHSCKIVPPVERVFPDVFDMPFVTVDDHSTPVVVQQQVAGIGLTIILYAEFDECLRHIQVVNEVLNDAIVAELGKNLKLNLR